MAITLAEIEQLSVKERIQLIGEIWDSIETSSNQIELTQAQKDELDRRMADSDANPENGVSWEEVREKMMARREAKALDRAEAIEGIQRGLEAGDAGRVRSAEEVFADMRAKIAGTRTDL